MALSLLIARTRATRGWDATVPADPGCSRPSEPGSAAPGNGTFLTRGEDQTPPPFASSSQPPAAATVPSRGLPQASIVLLLGKWASRDLQM
ncbi:unnamed protein product [Urochloa humidicola]